MGRATAPFAGLIGILALAGASGAKMAVLHGAVTITGGLTVTGAFDDPLPVATCADVAARGTMGDGSPPLFNVPEPPEAHGDPGSVGGGHT
ncbi:MAG TPA: hypothetical protein VIX35_01405, partial [Vicinamibacterales bacterium]